MHYITTYQQSCVTILNNAGKIIGCGIAIDCQHVLTCAHVLNAALGQATDSVENQTGREIIISFPLNTLLSNQSRKTVATIVKWCPTGPRLTIDTDVSVLEIKNVDIIDALKAVEKDIEFIGASLTGPHHFKSIYFDSSSPDQSSVEIYGKVGSFFEMEGKTAIFSDHDTMPFIQPGASGSAIYSEDRHGIIGITNALKKFNAQPGAKTGFIVDARAIAKLIPGFRLRQHGLAFYGDDKIKKATEVRRQNAKYMCDRKEMINYISSKITNGNNGCRLPVILTNYLEQEDTYDLNIRYKSEFIDPEFQPRLATHYLRIPDISDLQQFKLTVLQKFTSAIGGSAFRLDYQLDSDIYTILNSTNYLANKAFFCIIECELESLSLQHVPCLNWLADHFLKLRSVNTHYPDVHFLLIGKFEGNQVANEIEILRKGFGVTHHSMLENVTFDDVLDWIDMYIEDNMKSSLRRRFVKRPYQMQQIFSIYEEFNQPFLI